MFKTVHVATTISLLSLPLGLHPPQRPSELSYSEVAMLVKASVVPTASVAVQALSVPADSVVPLIS